MFKIIALSLVSGPKLLFHLSFILCELTAVARKPQFCNCVLQEPIKSRAPQLHLEYRFYKQLGSSGEEHGVGEAAGQTEEALRPPAAFTQGALGPVVRCPCKDILRCQASVWHLGWEGVSSQRDLCQASGEQSCQTWCLFIWECSELWAELRCCLCLIGPKTQSGLLLCLFRDDRWETETSFKVKYDSIVQRHVGFISVEFITH